ncbi:MAG TPA: polysaccharide export protein EpsE [Azospira sp.]|nr:polysaccharide export protein EpsE [Azospira sp.]
MHRFTRRLRYQLKGEFSRLVASCLLALVALAALTLTAPARAAGGDILGPGDSVRVTVFQNPDLTTETRISAQGSILMPLIGPVDLRGMTPDDAVARIAQRLKDGQFLVDPQVSLSVLQVRSRQVSVLGQVTRPGRYALDDSSPRLVDVIALAGGITPTGDDTVTVMSQRDGQPKAQTIDLARIYRDGDATANIEIASGDTIFVQRAPVFYIYGEVQRAGAYRLERDINVVQALSLGGGVTLRGTERGMRIHRRNADGSLNRIDVQAADRVHPDDVIYVKESLF